MAHRPPRKKTADQFFAAADVGPMTQPRDIRYTVRFSPAQHADLKRVVDCTHHSLQSLICEILDEAIGDDVEAYIDGLLARRRGDRR